MERTGIPLDRATYDRLDQRGTPSAPAWSPTTTLSIGCTTACASSPTVSSIIWCARTSPGPTTQSGALDLRDDTFRQMAEIYPQLAHLHQLRGTMAKLRLNSIVLGADGRNRCLLGQFVASPVATRHQAGKFIFGPSRWLRGLIRPERGRVLVYLDWSAQEFVIAAALSGDQHMLDAIASGDAYVWFARMARLAPDGRPGRRTPTIREICKRCCLGVLYGMGMRALAFRTGRSELEARELLEHHRRIFPTFWAWSGPGGERGDAASATST